MVKPLQKDEIEFDKWSEDVKRVVRVRRKGRLFHVSGEEIALFQINVMAESIERNVKTIRRWELDKLWPVPQWSIPDKRCKRWYSSNQIMTINAEYRKMSKGEFGFAHSAYFPLEEFFKFVKSIFYKVDAQIVAQARSKQQGAA